MLLGIIGEFTVEVGYSFSPSLHTHGLYGVIDLTFLLYATTDQPVVSLARVTR